MDIEQLNKIALELKSFAELELDKAKAIHGFNIASAKIGIDIISDIVKRVDVIKKEFAGISNEQAQDLAVQAARQILDFMLLNRLGTIGKYIYAIIPNACKDNLCKMIVDAVVHMLHKQGSDNAKEETK